MSGRTVSGEKGSNCIKGTKNLNQYQIWNLICVAWVCQYYWKKKSVDELSHHSWPKYSMAKEGQHVSDWRTSFWNGVVRIPSNPRNNIDSYPTYNIHPDALLIYEVFNWFQSKLRILLRNTYGRIHSMSGIQRGSIYSFLQKYWYSKLFINRVYNPFPLHSLHSPSFLFPLFFTFLLFFLSFNFLLPSSTRTSFLSIYFF